MKKFIGYLIIMIAVITLYGCRDKDKETNFIPTPAVAPEDEEEDGLGTEETDSDTEDPVEEDTTGDETVDLEYLGKTTTKYVRLNTYDAILNIRATPSTDGEIVGFLVHTEKIEVIGIENGWASLVYQDKICYVNADFLSDKKPVYIDPPTVTPSPTPGPEASVTPPEI